MCFEIPVATHLGQKNNVSTKHASQSLTQTRLKAATAKAQTKLDSCKQW